MPKQWIIVSFNSSFSRKADEFLKENNIKPVQLREKTFLVHTESKIFQKKGIQPFLISAQKLKKFANETAMKKFIQKKSKKGKKYALRAWVLNDPKLTGRDLEVRVGMALEKMGVEMNPRNEERIWFIIKNKKDIFTTPEPLSLDHHLFAPMDYRITENGYITRSGQKLRFLLQKFQFDPKGKVGVDLGSGTGGCAGILEKGSLDRSQTRIIHPKISRTTVIVFPKRRSSRGWFRRTC